MKQTGITQERPKISLNQFLNKTTFDSGDNGFVDEMLLSRIFKKKDDFEIIDDDPSLDKLTYVIKSVKVDSKTTLRSLEPYKIYVCDKCGLNLVKQLNIDDSQDIDKIMEEQPEAKDAFMRLITNHKAKVHPGIAPSQSITKRQYLEAQKFGKELA